MTEPRLSETRYAITDDGARLAYRTVGAGPPDVLWSFSQLSDVAAIWEYRPIADFLRALATSARVVVHDRRGMGRSGGDRGGLDTDVTDLRRLLDTVGASRPYLSGAVIGGAVYAAFAARHPERVAGVAWHGPFAQAAASANYPWGASPEELGAYGTRLAREWGTEAFAADFVAGGAPSAAGDEATIRFFAHWMRQTGDPATAAAYNQAWDAVDLHPVLPAVRVPVLLTSRAAEPSEAAYVASLMPNARLVTFEGSDFMPFYEAEPIIAALRDFMA